MYLILATRRISGRTKNDAIKNEAARVKTNFPHYIYVYGDFSQHKGSKLGSLSDLNLTGLLVTRQTDNTSPGGATIFHQGNQSKALTRDANLDTQSSDISAEEIRESGRSFHFLIVCGKKLLLYASLLTDGV